MAHMAIGNMLIGRSSPERIPCFHFHSCSSVIIAAICVLEQDSEKAVTAFVGPLRCKSCSAQCVASPEKAA